MNDMKSIRFPPPVADDMVRAIQADRKTVTRRVVKLKPSGEIELQDGLNFLWLWDKEQNEYTKSPYHPGDILYVRETWAPSTGGIVYKADCPYEMPKWQPSIHMPREAARIFLRVTDVRVERLQKIMPTGIILEGVLTPPEKLFSREEASARMKEVWNSTIKPADFALYGWDADPWVWVIEFERISREEATR